MHLKASRNAILSSNTTSQEFQKSAAANELSSSPGQSEITSDSLFQCPHWR